MRKLFKNLSFDSEFFLNFLLSSLIKLLSTESTDHKIILLSDDWAPL